MQEAVAQARTLDHPQPLAFALLFEIFAHLARRSPRDVQKTYEQLAVVCHAHGIAQEVQWAAPLCGRALLELGEVKRGLRVLEEGLAAHTITRSALLRPYYFVLLAGALLRVKEYERAQRALDDARAVAASTSQHAYASELHRLQAELLTLTGNRDGAERSYREAFDDGKCPGRAVARAARRPRVRQFPGRSRTRGRGALRPAADARAHHRRAGDARLRLRRRSSTYAPVAVRGKLDLPAKAPKHRYVDNDRQRREDHRLADRG